MQFRSRRLLLASRRIQLIFQLFLLLQELLHHVRKFVDLLILLFDPLHFLSFQRVVIHLRAISLRIQVDVIPIEIWGANVLPLLHVYICPGRKLVGLNKSLETLLIVLFERRMVYVVGRGRHHLIVRALVLQAVWRLAYSWILVV